MASRSKSSARWLREHRNDPFVKGAREQGFRSRAAYKLLDIDDRDRFLTPGIKVVDLGAAPGGWSQLAAQRIGRSGRVIAVDILPMQPIPGVEIIQGDFEEMDGLGRIRKVLQGAEVQVVMSDMAPNISGIRDVDQARSIRLAESTLAFAEEVLSPGATLLTKVFQGEGYDEFRRKLTKCFTQVKTRKPRASRSRSRETYLFATGYDV